MHSMSGEQMENVNRRLVTNLRDISHTMRGLYEGKGSQRRVLIVLHESGNITQRELTRRLGIQSASASEVIGKLENMGLITRSPSGVDRRTVDIVLTEEGRRQAETAVEQRKQRQTKMFSGLSEKEKTQLLSLLEKLNEDWKERYPGNREHQDGCLDSQDRER